MIGENYDDWRREVYIPISTFKSIYGDPGKIPSMTLVVDNLDTKEKNKDFEEKIRHMVAQNHNFNEKDKAAMYIWNKFAQKLRIQETIFLLKVGAWIVGILSLLSGIIGVSNIVFISVKERTHEIGIRRALGAKPSSIYLMVLGESITITTIFGYFGMVAGVAMTKFLDFFSKILNQSDIFQLFINPNVGLDVALEATLMMILVGILAGIFPARKAIKIRPVEALMNE